MPEAVPTTTTVSTDVGPAIVPDLESFPATGTPIHKKLASWDFYRAIGSPTRVVAPMVDQSELPWRIISRRYGSDLVYTPMINAKLFADENSKKKKVKYQEVNFNKEHCEEGTSSLSHLLSSEGEGSSTDTDRPLFVQFCSNDPDTLLKAAQVVEDRCDAVDLNLGCPQHIARRGHYGSYLMEDWALIFSLINTLHINLKVPVTAKMRVYESVEKTVAYAKVLERAGAQIITVHGRTRNMKGHHTGLADWTKIKAVKHAVNVPVFANGNVLYPQDYWDAMTGTGADGIMSAEGNLYNPAIFMHSLPKEPSVMFPAAPELPFPSIANMAHEYLDIVGKLKTPTQSSAIKAHLFRLCRPALEVHRDLREVLGKSRFDDKATGTHKIVTYRKFVEELERRLEQDMLEEKWQSQPNPPLPGSVSFLTQPDENRPAYVPHWLAQPYFRPPLVEGAALTEEEKKKRGERVAESKKGTAQGKKNEGDMLVVIEDVQTEGEAKVARQRSDSAEPEQQGMETKKVKLNDQAPPSFAAV
ncbi:related to tRNA dihydrouridine synthase [Melanopsichium pennsylvanicum]|uniref:tRNA-dihydrouridine(16/17) synthase [NAD(P)(+)] n=2 Tax=Melanopsichium pennsylvanicum TaxID=63383 RepID=A0AAJ5C356_9BASI|nr:related to tRNA dihydrouridine synthase [Melanopsichium pennsylvanicum 4]SNX82246.1 related to tRNA dihydrouridine synthase [Melanopsichium pennsylvanicum]